MNARRSTFTLLSVALMIALAVVAGGQSQERRLSKKAMEGSWKVIVTPGQAPIPLPPAIESIITYVPGGGLIESDSLAVPGSIASSGQGAWEVADLRQFNITFTKYLYGFQGESLGAVKIIETISRDVSDTEYTGEGRMEILNPAGAPLFAIPVTTRATLIRAEAP